jgi:hypothetical protein
MTKHIQMINLLADIKKANERVVRISCEKCNDIEFKNLNKLQASIFFAQAILENMQQQIEQNKFKILNGPVPAKYRVIYSYVDGCLIGPERSK